MKQQVIYRRQFIKNAALALSTPLIFGCRGSISAQKTEADVLTEIKKNAIASGDMSWSGAKDAPADISWRAVISSESTSVVPIMISGTVYQKDGSTPAPNALIYLYHTDVRGLYGRGTEHRHGRYRGWMLTGDDGRYEFRSIKPASYPDSTIASHIHMTVTTRDMKEDWVDSILFEGDRFITARERVIQKGGHNAILKLTEGKDGVFRGVRDIRLWG